MSSDHELRCEWGERGVAALAPNRRDDFMRLAAFGFADKFQASFGDQAVAPGAISVFDDTRVHVLVPNALPVGVCDLRMDSGAGATAVLQDALMVVASEPASSASR